MRFPVISAGLLFACAISAAFDPTYYELTVAVPEYSSDDFFAALPSVKPVYEKQYLQFFVDRWNTEKTFFPNHNVTIKLLWVPSCNSASIGILP
jgi:hypothetical protein